MEKASIEIQHTRDFPITSLDDEAWAKGRPVTVTQYWSGREAPATRQFSARLLWSETALYARFEAARSEPLIVSTSPELLSKTIGLWERDVCELFIAPDSSEPNKYYEFEIAPTGEWLDLAIDSTGPDRVTDWDYISKMGSSASVDEDRTVMAITIPFESLGRSPKTGEIWRGNIFRCVGEGPERGYLAWRPTLTGLPSFHVPEAFGEFVFR